MYIGEFNDATAQVKPVAAEKVISALEAVSATRQVSRQDQVDLVEVSAGGTA